ncbi:hypothetical protein BJ973_001673 [Actinoplanes tereljensis]|uniref:Uncharacterized protein n=1 Tax=Paractinoplanes tereljensis TaxID=571912 RepID=A0A919NKZ4_9ACTN|nr:hypothetical protein [Actinoplanes tereljensis]GIF20423.1 hypothetical protein Ate02nite_31530 [Actinoplanes tereljensis]
MVQRAGPSRAEVTQGVDKRLETTLHAYPGLRLETVPAQFLRTPPTTSGIRILRGGRLPEADDEVFEVVAELWRDSGAHIEDAEGLDGRLLVAQDSAGYVISLVRHADDDPILTVASPPIPQPFLDRALVAGLSAGFGAGCLGPCISTVVPSSVIPALSGAHLTYWAWVPLFLLVAAGSLYFPETRRFGTGLIIGGVLIGLPIVAMFG